MLRKAILNAIVLIALVTPCISDTFKSTGATDAYFSPRGGATDAIVNEINLAKQEIQVQAYSFTSKSIAKALVNACKSDIKIENVKLVNH